MKPVLIHVPHSSTHIPEEYAKTALIPGKELEEENLFMCDTGIVGLIPPALREDTLIFPYSRLYCDVERFRDGSEPMEKYGMGFVYTRDSRGREMFRPTEEHIREVAKIYDRHHARLNQQVDAILKRYGRCLIIDLHSFSDETVNRLFGWSGFSDVCIGTEKNHYSEEIVAGIENICRGLGLSTQRDYPYKGALVPGPYYDKPDTGIVSVMIEINKRLFRTENPSGSGNVNKNAGETLDTENILSKIYFKRSVILHKKR